LQLYFLFFFHNLHCFNIRTFHQLLKWDISRLGAERRRKHFETCEAVLERGGWSPISITQPRGLSFTKTITGFAKKINHL